MDHDDSRDRKGWAGQWDRHRWKVKVVNPPPSQPRQPERRLRSLDEFKPLRWHRPHPAAPQRPGPELRVSGPELWAMSLACIFVGVAAWVSS